MSESRTSIKRRVTTPVNVGGVVIGGAARIPVQTMTKTQTEDARATLAQIERAAAAGADIIRVTCDKSSDGRRWMRDFNLTYKKR